MLRIPHTSIPSTSFVTKTGAPRSPSNHNYVVTYSEYYTNYHSKSTRQYADEEPGYLAGTDELGLGEGVGDG